MRSRVRSPSWTRTFPPRPACRKGTGWSSTPWGDGTCRQCHKGNEQLCTGSGGWIGFGPPGGFAEYVTVPSRHLIRIDADSGPDRPGAGGRVRHTVTAIRLDDINDRLAALGRGDVIGRQVVVFN